MVNKVENIHRTFKISRPEYGKSGYIVTEEELNNTISSELLESEKDASVVITYNGVLTQSDIDKIEDFKGW